MKWYRVEGIEDINKPFIKKVKAGDTSVCLVGYEGLSLPYQPVARMPAATSVMAFVITENSFVPSIVILMTCKPAKVAKARAIISTHSRLKLKEMLYL